MNLFAISIFLASAQLFLVQPMFAKRLLPILGGTPSVWNTCMLFYQILLLAGYVYAHVLTSRWSLRRQLSVHAVLLFLPLYVLWLGPPHWSPPDSDHAVLWLLSYLLLSVGLPFFVLSTNAPLVQRWFSLRLGKSSKNAYFLYAASNIGSMCALLAYPTLVEPFLRLSEQYSLFQGLYIAFVIVMVAIIAKSWQSLSAQEVLPEHKIESDSAGGAAVVGPDPQSSTSSGSPDNGAISNLSAALSRVIWKERARWILLSFIPSSLLLSVTTYVTSNIAPCPLFWIVPLALYLLTFIIAFSSRQFINRKFLLAVHALLIVALSVVFFWTHVEFSFLVMFPLHLAAFFFASLVCHQQLADSRPDASRLTEFYLCLAIGGAVGGTFNTLVAPMLFKSYVEYPAVLALSCIARPEMPMFGKRWGWRFGSTMLCLCLLSIALAYSFAVNLSASWSDAGDYMNVLVLGPSALFALIASGQPMFMLLCTLCILLVGGNLSKPDILYQGRNLFGSLMVVSRTDKAHYLVHGNILHGAEFMDGPLAHEPLTYFNRDSPIGHIFEAYDAKLEGANISVVGLGAGTMAAYAKPGQHWTFYEINPMIAKVATDSKLFQYLSRSQASMKIVLGDGRQSIAEEPDQSVNLMAFDAFSSDSIPVHLLTREALQLYLSKLAPGGVLAFHISSLSVDLKPPLRELARDAHLACAWEQSGQSLKFHQDHKLASLWFVMARSESDLAPLETRFHFTAPSASPAVSLWTDDFSNLVGSLKLN